MQASQESKESMFSLIDKWQSSRTSQKVFCEEHNIRYHVFHYWYKRFKNNVKSEPPSAGRFIKLQTTSISTGAFAEVILVGGEKITFHQPVSADYLKALL